MDRGSIHDTLKRYWGYDSFRAKQEEIINSVLLGKDTLGLLPTGGGKSITFQVPAMLLDGLTIVVTPLIALMKDQADGLRDRHINAAYIHSGLRHGEIRNVIDRCVFGKCKFLYISPERLASSSFIESLRRMKVSLIVVDEAHCISQWGYDFRPSYLNIASIRQLFPDAPVLALTASATPAVVADIMQQLQFKEPNVIRKSFRRDNLSYIVRHQENKTEKLYSALSRIYGSGIIYVRSRAKTKDIAEQLKSQGFSADYYHAGLPTEEKRDKQDKWKRGEIRIIVATNAFGMGIDKPDVRFVMHLDVPNSLEEYYQEAGRAGRDGKKAYVMLLVSSKDEGTLKRRISEAFPPKDFIKDVYTHMCDFLGLGIGAGYDKVFDFNLQLFCSTFKLPERQTYSALKILSACQYIDYIDEVDTLSRIMILVEKRELYNVEGMTPEMDNVLELILRNFAGVFSDYIFIDEPTIAYKHNIPVNKIYETLLFLSRKHIITYIPRKRTAYIFFPYSRMEPRHLTIHKEAYEVGKQRLELRINSMIDYVSNQTSCREAKILKYFGEENTCNCGHCDICVERKKASSSEKELADGILYMLSLKSRTLKEITDTLAFPAKDIAGMTRFLLKEGKITYTDGLLSIK